MKTARGFALVELLVVLAILGVVLAVIFTPISNSFKYFGFQSEKTNIIIDARTAMDYLTREIRKADIVNTEGNTLILDDIVYRSEEGKLLKGNEIAVEGNYQLFVEAVTSRDIKVEILVKDGNGEEYRLASVLKIR
ncbi:MAG: type II secretion system protein [Bacillota bacterium]